MNPPTTTSTLATRSSHAPVTVIGLGLMGSALASAFLAAGHRTTVWNRTPGRADALVGQGAEPAVALSDALTASPIVIACASTYDVLRELISPVAGALQGRTLVNLTSGTPEQARGMGVWATEQGIDYLDGAIMAVPQMIATPAALLLYSGSRSAFEAHEPVLVSLGKAQYLGVDAALASVHDVALLGMMYATQYGVLHAMALVGVEGVSATRFLPLAQALYDVIGSFIPGLAHEVDAGDYTTDVATLEVDRAALGHIVGAAERSGLETRVFDAIRDLAARAVDAGYGGDSFSAVVDAVRGGTRRLSGGPPTFPRASSPLRGEHPMVAE